MKKTLLLICLFVISFSQAQIINFPDGYFKAALMLNMPAIDTNGDGEIQVAEANTYSSKLSLSNRNITDATGISYFTSVTDLEIHNNQLTGLDLSSNLSLTRVLCYYNQLTSLNLNGLTSLKVLSAQSNQLASLNISTNTALEGLSCGYNQLMSLDVSANIALSNFGCSDNQLSSLDVSTNTVLTHFDCSNNQLMSLDLTTNGVLYSLTCNNNVLTDLNLTSNLNLGNFNCVENQLTNLNVNGLTLLTEFDCSHNQLSSLNVSTNTGLIRLYCSQNSLLTNINLNGATSLYHLYCNQNNLTDLDVSNNTLLRTLDCYYNQLASLDLSNNTELRDLNCIGNQLITLDLNDNINLINLNCANNNLLKAIFIKNDIQNYSYTYGFNLLPNLEYICVDVQEQTQIKNKVDGLGYVNCVVNSYCSFSPGGTNYEIQGQNIFDFNSNGCDIADPIYSNLKFDIIGGVNNGSFISNTTGSFSMPFQAGVHTITPQLENSTYFTVSPSNIVVDFPTTSSPYSQDFCIYADGVYNDLEVTILPVTAASPGFNASYQIIYKNKGTTTLSGSVDFTFNNDVQDYVNASPVPDTQSVGSLVFNYVNLLPFETRVIALTMNLNTPTDATNPVNEGDVLDFVATINPVSGDEMPDDNIFELHQTVVNSYDPNDKTCLEGTEIHTSKVGEYVHYMIRFENNGTANAVNVVVKDIIDTAKYDINTLIPQHGSHNFVTRVRFTNTVEFIFENINLPFDDANNDGYVAFKIKTLATLVDGDVFENNAEIYFDYNAAIITNVAQTTVASVLAISDYEIDTTIGMYPNPANVYVKVKSVNNLKEITIIGINGRVIQTVSVIGLQTEKEIDISSLSQGIYFIKVLSDKGQQVKKIVKN